VGEPYVGEIRIFAGSFAPAGWAMCQGQLMPISENETLFNLIGTTYGGDGQETFALPDLQGRVPLHQGQGPGISQSYLIGEQAGVEDVTLTVQQTPIHNHAFLCTNEVGQQGQPGTAYYAQVTTGQLYNDPLDPLVQFNANMLSIVGGSQPHENMQPFLVITFIISLFGVFPSQN
jgi:microcystin-dependent protein